MIDNPQHSKLLEAALTMMEQNGALVEVLTGPDDAEFLDMERRVLELCATDAVSDSAEFQENMEWGLDLNDAILLTPPSSLTCAAVKLRRLACQHTGIETGGSLYHVVAIRQLANFLSTLTGGPTQPPLFAFDIKLDAPFSGDQKSEI